MEEEKATSPEFHKEGSIELPNHSGATVYLGPERTVYCNKCGTKVGEGQACGENLAVVFWYCSTCDEFVHWDGLGIAAEMSEQCQASVKSFLRSLRSSG